MYTHQTQLRVRYGETDAMGVVYHGNYAEYFEVARVEALRHLNIVYADLEQEGYVMPVVEMNTKFIRSALYDDVLTLKTSLANLPSDHKLTYQQEIYNAAGTLLTLATITTYTLKKEASTQNLVKATCPEKLYAALVPFFGELALA
jgi:acyl-CoA thioester hydrolase